MKIPVTSFVMIVLSCGAWADTAERVLEQSGVRGGVVVVLGCEEPELLVGLRAGDAYLVQGLDTDPENVQKAREVIRSQGPYGAVSVGGCDGSHF